MDRFRASILLAAPLAAAVVGSALQGPAPPAARLALAPASLEHCRRAAELLYDVHWAAACARLGADESVDCMLPDPQAARVNAILQSEEARCLATEALASRAQ